MAKQSGQFPLQGTLGNTTFVRSKRGGFHARWKTSLTKKKMAENPNFIRQREQNAEFTRASIASQLLRKSFNTIMGTIKDGSMVNRLNRLMQKVIQQDAVSNLGLRNVLDGELELLNGFEFSDKGSLFNIFTAAHSIAIDRATGIVSVSIPPFSIAEEVKKSPVSTHFRITIGAAAINFETGGVSKNFASTEQLDLANTEPTEPIELTVELEAASTDPVFLLMRVDFSTLRSNGNMYPVLNNAFNTCAIIEVNTGV